MPIHLHIGNGYFSTLSPLFNSDVIAELNSRDRDYTSCKVENIPYLALHRKGLLNADTDNIIVRKIRK